MKDSEITEYVRETESAIVGRRLKEAFDYLSLMLEELQNWQLKDKKDNVEENYKIMLKYYSEGVKDPEMDKVYADLLRSMYKLFDEIVLRLEIKFRGGLYFEKKRISLVPTDNNIKNITEYIKKGVEEQSLSLLVQNEESGKSRSYLIEKRLESLYSNIFQSLWLNEDLDADDVFSIESILSDSEMPSALKCLSISAMSLSLQFCFDEKKLIFLLDACRNSDEQVRQRALVGLLLALRKYDKRLSLYSSVVERLQDLQEDRNFVKDVRNIILLFILSSDTEKITKKIQEEIIPEMMKLSPVIGKKLNLDDLIGESGIEEKNPEWEDLIKGTKLEDRLKEFSEMHLEGADVMHSSFSNLKSYPFFNDISNWLLPFFNWHTELRSVFKDRSDSGLLQPIAESTMLCDSDKYSFFLSIANMPDSYRRMMSSQFSAQSEMIDELQNEDLLSVEKRKKNIAKQYVQDLYRFYKLYSRHQDFEDIFELKTDLICVPSIRSILSDSESLMIVGEYYFGRGHYREALQVFCDLIDKGDDNRILFQKKAYCFQMLGDTRSALDSYLNAELYDGNNSWLIKKIAYCFRLLKRPADALLYYQKAEALNPNNLSLEMSMGHCCMDLKKYDDALQHYFKVEFLDKNGKKAWRPIAWCSFLYGKYEQASAYFEKITGEAPHAVDYLNYGHVKLAMGNIPEAFKYYEKSIRFEGNTPKKFKEAFMEDASDLIAAGIKEENIPLVLDRVLYSL